MARKIRNLRTRFIVAGGLLLAAVVACGVWSIVTIERLGESLGSSLDARQRTINVAVEMILSLEREDSDLLAALQGDAPEALARLAQERRRFDEGYAELRDKLTNDADRAAYELLGREVDAYRKIGDSLIGSAGRDDAFALYYRSANPGLREAVGACRYFRETNVQAMQHEGITARQNARRSMLIVSTITLAAVLLSAGVLLRLTKGVTGPIGELDRALEAVRHDELDHRVPVRSTDELGRLAAGFNRMAERLAADRRETEERFHQLAENIREIYWVMKPDGKIAYISPGYEEVWGRTREALYAADVDARLAEVHADDRVAYRRAHEANLHGAASTCEFRIVRPDGGERWIRSRAFPIKDDLGSVVRVAGLCEDITPRKQLELDIRHAKETAESANRAKDEFLANVSHEIRTPMNAILGLTELVLESEIDDDRRQCLKTVKSAADNLLGIINDLLDFSKIEADKLEPVVEPFSLRGVVGETLRGLAERAHRQNLELISHIDPAVPDGLVGDGGRLRQVLLNLVGNGIKFTPQGEVLLRIEQAEVAASESAPAGPVVLRFTVADTGIGIPPELHGRIFLPFEQQDASTTRRYGGTGLGLPIAARLVEMMGGTIGLESKVGVGSRFTFTARFDVHATTVAVLEPATEASLRELRVLVVDDNATNRRVLVEMLRHRRIDAVTADGGPSAVAALEQAAEAGVPYGLVILDMHMPGLDGLEVAAQIRRGNRPEATRIILLTSGARFGDVGRMRELKIEAHLQKPVGSEELYETVRRVMGGDVPSSAQAGAPAPSAGPPSPPARRLKILVAEDNEFNSETIARLLAHRGHEVALVGDGRQALERVEAEAFDLLLLDIHMPHVDGFAAIRAIRRHSSEVVRRLRVIALTARSRPEDRERCLAAGMDGFLTKPVVAAELFGTIERPDAGPAAPKRLEEPVAPSTLVDPSTPVDPSTSLDPGVLLASCGGNDATLEALCRALGDNLPRRLATLRARFDEGSVAELREEAHKLCGMISTFSSSAGTMAEQLETLAESGSLEGCGPLVDELSRTGVALLKRTEGLTVAELHRLNGKHAA